MTIGIGMGLVVGTVDAQAIGEVDPKRLGMATGFLNTLRAGGATLVTTLFGTGIVTLLQQGTGDAALAAWIAAGGLAGPDRAAHAVLLTGAWHVAPVAVALGCVVAVVAVRRLLGTPPRRPDDLERRRPPVAPS